MNSLSLEFIVSITSAISTLAIVLYLFMNQVKKKAQEKLSERYDFEKMRVELDYMRKNIEMQQYEISKKLEENMNRWKDVNHLVISSQNKAEQIESLPKQISDSDFLKKFNVKDVQIDPTLVFVLTPFNDEYNDSFETIRDTCFDYGLRCIRGDEEFIDGDILPNIIKNIAKARFIIANISGRNPNVYYELGIAHALNKSTIIVAKNFGDVPFDLKSQYLTIYENLDDLGYRLKEMFAKISLSGKF